MAATARLKAMLMGPKYAKADQMSMNDDPEDTKEIKAGKPPSAKEEMLEDMKGRPIKMKMKSRGKK
jgi:hypothetical protein